MSLLSGCSYMCRSIDDVGGEKTKNADALKMQHVRSELTSPRHRVLNGTGRV